MERKQYKVIKGFKVALLNSEDSPTGTTTTVPVGSTITLEHFSDKATFGFRLEDGRLGSYDDCQYMIDEFADDADEDEREELLDRQWEAVQAIMDQLMKEIK
jgi:hypothetical protein